MRERKTNSLCKHICTVRISWHVDAMLLKFCFFPNPTIGTNYRTLVVLTKVKELNGLSNIVRNISTGKVNKAKYSNIFPSIDAFTTPHLELVTIEFFIFSIYVRVSFIFYSKIPVYFNHCWLYIFLKIIFLSDKWNLSDDYNKRDFKSFFQYKDHGDISINHILSQHRPPYREASL